MDNQLQALVEKWRREAANSSLHKYGGEHPATAVRLCADELAALLAQHEAPECPDCRRGSSTYSDGTRIFPQAICLQHETPTPSQWQPIETALKDGTVIDVWTVHGRVPNVRWWDVGRAWLPKSGPPAPLVFPETTVAWMPLPAPPESR